MGTPISRRQMLRRLLLAALEDVSPPDEIRFWEPGETGHQPTMTMAVGTAAAARAWSVALDLTFTHESGQPSPLTAAAPNRWMGALTGDVAGWNVHLQFDEPYTAAHEAVWLAKDGLRLHPRTESGEVPDA